MTIDTTSSTYMGVALGPNDAGCFDWNVTNPSTTSGDNVMAITVTSSSSITSGLLQGAYVYMKMTGSYTTGSTQVNGFATDLIWVGGTVGCEVSGMYVYMGGSGSPTLTSSEINGLTIYVDDVGGTPGQINGVKIHIADDSTKASYIYAKCAGSGTALNFLCTAGETLPTYFLSSSGSDTTSFMIRNYTPSTAATKSLMCLIGGAVYRIALVADSCD